MKKGKKKMKVAKVARKKAKKVVKKPTPDIRKQLVWIADRIETLDRKKLYGQFAKAFKRPLGRGSLAGMIFRYSRGQKDFIKKFKTPFEEDAPRVQAPRVSPKVTPEASVTPVKAAPKALAPVAVSQQNSSAPPPALEQVQSKVEPVAQPTTQHDRDRLVAEGFRDWSMGSSMATMYAHAAMYYNRHRSSAQPILTADQIPRIVGGTDKRLTEFLVKHLNVLEERAHDIVHGRN